MIQFPSSLDVPACEYNRFLSLWKIIRISTKRVEGALFEQQLHLQGEHYQALINAHNQIRGISMT